MNCQNVQSKILALPDPRVIPDALREHAAGCVECRAWLRQAGRLETLLAAIPAPPAPANRKAAFLDSLASGRPVEVASRRSATMDEGAASRRSYFAMGGLAAAVLLAVGGFWLANRPSTSPPAAQGSPRDPFLEKLVQRNLALARETDQVERLKLLEGMAEDLSGQAHTLARVSGGADLQELALWFDRVKDGLVKQARPLPGMKLANRVERKKQVDELAAKLSELADQAEKLSQTIPEDAKPAIRKIADSARDGEKKLRGLQV